MRQDAGMSNDGDELEPIIATRPHRAPLREESAPLWPLVLALTGGLAAVLLLAWWFFGRSAEHSAPAPSPVESPLPETHVEPQPLAPTTDLDANDEIAQAPAPEPSRDELSADSTEQGSIPQSTPESSIADEIPGPVLQPLSPADTASVLFTSPDPQVQFEVRALDDASAPLTGKAGESLDLAPGIYRVVAFAPGFESLEREIELTGTQPAEYSVELCIQPERETASLVGEILERRTCTSTVECESAFMILSEYAEQLVKDAAFRREQCAKWRTDAQPEGKWTFETKCDGEVSATTCRVEIAVGTCTVIGPRRTARGGTCPRADLR